MDETDKRLLLMLMRDGRASAADLGRALSVSRGTVQNRIEKMTRDGIIDKFTVEIGQGEVDNQVSAFAMISLKTNGDAVVKAAMRRIEEITSVSTLSGNFDLVIELRCASLSHMDVVLDRVRSLPDVADTQSHIRLRTWNN